MINFSTMGSLNQFQFRNIFAEHAELYRSLGHIPIPLIGKRPFLNGWQNTTDASWPNLMGPFMVSSIGELPEFLQAQLLDIKKPAEPDSSEAGTTAGEKTSISERSAGQPPSQALITLNLGLLLGPTAIGIDIDSYDEPFVQAIRPMFAHSQMMRRGEKGFVALFQSDPAIHTQRSKDLPYELLSMGTQVVMPPSIHPDTQLPYEWLQGCLPLPTDKLPHLYDGIMGESVMDELRQAALDYRATRHKKSLSITGQHISFPYIYGRNNQLTQMAYAKAASGMHPDQATTELLDWDAANHQPPYFQDEHESDWHSITRQNHGQFSAIRNAEAFVRRAYDAHVKRSGLEPKAAPQVTTTMPALTALPVITDVTTEALTTEVITAEAITQPASKSAPTMDLDAEMQRLIDEPHIQSFNTLVHTYDKSVNEIAYKLIERVPFLRDYSAKCRQNRMLPAPMLDMAGGISMLSALSGNIFSYSGTRSNVFALASAPSGVGKGYPQKLALDVLNASISGSKFLGTSRYRSMNALYLKIKNNSRHVRFDIQDEVTDLFKRVSNIDKGNAGTIPELLNGLWSASHSYLPPQNIQNKDAQIDGIANPFVVFYGSTTIEGITKNMTNELLTNGFCARTLWFFQPIERVHLFKATRSLGFGAMDFVKSIVIKTRDDFEKAVSYLKSLNVDPLVMDSLTDKFDHVPLGNQDNGDLEYAPMSIEWDESDPLLTSLTKMAKVFCHVERHRKMTPLEFDQSIEVNADEPIDVHSLRQKIDSVQAYVKFKERCSSYRAYIEKNYPLIASIDQRRAEQVNKLVVLAWMGSKGYEWATRLPDEHPLLVHRSVLELSEMDIMIEPWMIEWAEDVFNLSFAGFLWAKNKHDAEQVEEAPRSYSDVLKKQYERDKYIDLAIDQVLQVYRLERINQMTIKRFNSLVRGLWKTTRASKTKMFKREEDFLNRVRETMISEKLIIKTYPNNQAVMVLNDDTRIDEGEA